MTRGERELTLDIVLYLESRVTTYVEPSGNRPDE